MRRGITAVVLLAAGCGGSEAPPGGSRPFEMGDAYFPDDPLEILDPAFDPPRCCYVHVEAEWFDTAWRTQTNITPHHGHGFLTSGITGRPASSTPSHRLSLEPGEYTAWVRSYRDGDDRSLSLEIDDTLLPPTHGPSAEPGFFWVRAGTVAIARSDVTVRIHDTGDAAETPDAIVLTTRTDVTPAEVETRWRLFDPDVAADMAHDEIVARASRYGGALPIPFEPGQWTSRVSELRAHLLESLGLDPLPERTPLDAEVERVIERDGYSIEVIVFESRPGLHVTANVYVPDGEGPFPAVISPIGHGLDKRSHLATSRNHRLAQLGFITIVYDPFGQGERQVAGNEHKQHWTLALSGHSNMSIMVWDSVRALDFMLSRPDVDPERVAVTGYSGGGLNTLYFAAIDERVDVAVPAAYVTEFEPFLATGIGHDACTYVPGVARFTDMGEIAAMFAPKPYLVLSGEDDASFPVNGARDAVALARQRYRIAGAEDALAHAVFDVGHTYDRQMREVMYGFVSAALLGTSDDPIDEGELDLLPADDTSLLFYPSTRVPPDGLRVRELARRWAIEAIEALPPPEATSREALRADASARLAAPDGASPIVVDAGTFRSAHGFDVRRLEIDVGLGVRLPAHLYVHTEDAPIAVIADAAGLTDGASLDVARRAGVSALHITVRGRGEIAAPEAWQMASNMLLGDPLVVQRAFDLVQVRRALRELPATSHAPAALVALGAEASLEALFAQALYAEYDVAVLGPTFSTWIDTLTRAPPWSAYVHGILEVADVPQLVHLAAERPLSLELSTDTWMTHHGAWVATLEPEVELVERRSLLDDLRWVSAQLVD